jgi:hypothetical protein
VNFQLKPAENTPFPDRIVRLGIIHIFCPICVFSRLIACLPLEYVEDIWNLPPNPSNKQWKGYHQNSFSPKWILCTWFVSLTNGKITDSNLENMTNFYFISHNFLLENSLVTEALYGPVVSSSNDTLQIGGLAPFWYSFEDFYQAAIDIPLNNRRIGIDSATSCSQYRIMNRLVKCKESRSFVFVFWMMNWQFMQISNY